MGRSLGMAVLALALAETLVWAALYYVFPAMLPLWESEFGWTRGEISGAFTASLIVTGLLAPRAGRLIDSGNSTLMFTGAIAAGAGLLVALSMVETLWQFWAIWLAIGLINAACLYEACFAILTVALGARARKAITRVTLVAGFAGTVSFPAAHLLSQWLGWRGALQIFAGVTLLIALPLAISGLRGLSAHQEPAADRPRLDGHERRNALRKPAFWWLAICFCTIALIHGMILSHIRPIMADRGATEAIAVLVSSLVGPMQVLGRIMMISVEARLATNTIARACFGGILMGTILLLMSTGSTVLVIAFVVPYGAAYGVASIVRPVLTADLLGRAGYGVIAGMLAMPYMLGFAAGPTLAALLHDLAGYDLVIGVSACLAILGTGSLVMAGRTQRPA